jgi:hypothetical protein
MIGIIHPLIKAIKELKIKEQTSDKLIAKIITARQIERDF